MGKNTKKAALGPLFWFYKYFKYARERAHTREDHSWPPYVGHGKRAKRAF